MTGTPGEPERPMGASPADATVDAGAARMASSSAETIAPGTGDAATTAGGAGATMPDTVPGSTQLRDAVAAAIRAAREKPGEAIGPYVLLGLLGEGGFGAVWHAERREPYVQQVALKLIRAGMDSESVLLRFEQERQALALMDHPHIA